MSSGIASEKQVARAGTLPPTLYIAVFTVSMAVLMMEIALTRVFSVSVWYHLAFMVISTALLGFGASGTYLTLHPEWLKQDAERKLARFSALMGLAIVVCFALLTRVPLDPLAPLSGGISDAERTGRILMLVIWLLVEYVLVVIPFFFAGLTLGGTFTALPRRINALYFVDLVGAGAGCLIVVGLMWLLPPQGVILMAAGLAFLGALFYLLSHPPTARHTGHRLAGAPLLAPVAALALFIASPFAEGLLPLHIPDSKPLKRAYDDPTVDLVYTDFTPFARVDVMYKEGGSLGVWGLSKLCQAPPAPEQLFITIDAAAITTISRFDGDLEAMAFVNCAPSGLAYQMRDEPPDSALVVGPGGGIDVITALYNRTRRIIGVEINPLIVDLVRRDSLYRQYAGGLYTDYPQVEIEIAEARNFIASSAEKYDLIQISQVDTWAAAASGAYSLSENFLYTTEAFLDYYDHLTDDGLLTIGRWYFEPPRQAFRLVTIGTTALEQRGVTSPKDHFIVIRAGDTSTFIMKKTPFADSEIAQVRRTADRLGFTVLYAPGDDGEDNWFARFFAAADRDAFYRAYPYDLTPTTDNRPFFFEYYGWANFGDFRSGKVTLVILLAQALLLATALILWPLWRGQRRGLRFTGARRSLVYFASLGVGFIFIEVALMQRFIVFLGHPVFSTSVVLFSILTFAGLGSLLSGQLLRANHADDPRRIQRWVIPLLGLLTTLYIFALPPLFYSLLSLELTARVALSILLLAPLGLLLGMPFPLGIRLLEQVNPALIPWVWGINGFGSVVGSVLAVMIAQSYGFSLVIGLGVIIYLIGLTAVLSLPHPREHAPV